MTRRQKYESGPPCAICGNARFNVVHDSPQERIENMRPGHWAEDRPEQPGGYYVWAEIDYHPFTLARTEHVHAFRCFCGATP